MKNLPPPDVIKDVAVIGGGISGLLISSKLSKINVELFEALPNIGARKHCTGVISLKTMSLSYVRKEFIDNCFKRIVLLIPSIKILIEIKSPHIFACRIDRIAHEKWLASKVEEKGHKIFLHSRVLSSLYSKDNKLTFAVYNEGGINYQGLYDVAIVAEGYPPRFSRFYGMDAVMECLTGIQSEIYLHNKLELDFLETLLVIYDPLILSYGFAWAVPLSENVILIGIALKDKGYRVFEVLNSIIKVITKKLNLNEAYRGKPYGGIILRGYPKKIIGTHALALGDTIASIKSLSGGGLYAISVISSIYADILNNNSRISAAKTLINLLKKLKHQYRITRAVMNIIKMLSMCNIVRGKKLSIAVRELDYDSHEVLFHRILKKLLHIDTSLALKKRIELELEDST